MNKGFRGKRGRKILAKTMEAATPMKPKKGAETGQSSSIVANMADIFRPVE